MPEKEQPSRKELSPESRAAITNIYDEIKNDHQSIVIEAAIRSGITLDKNGNFPEKAAYCLQVIDYRARTFGLMIVAKAIMKFLDLPQDRQLLIDIINKNNSSYSDNFIDLVVEAIKQNTK